MNKKIRKPELMSPAGDHTMLRAAVNAGADAVYFGIEDFNMRAKAKNFSKDELADIVKYCKKNKVKTYLTLNTFIRNNKSDDIKNVIHDAKKAGIDMIICWDFAVIQICRNEGIPFCISTQASIANSAAAMFYEKLGAKRIVLARECTLDEIKEIRKAVKCEIEVFIHGAMCVAVSGRCFMSHNAFGKSANEGDCLQPCRREYLIKDPDAKSEFIIGRDYVMSAKDLCTVEFIDKLIEAGIDSFKIEGRKRSPEYTAKTTAVYRDAIDSYFNGTLTDEKKKLLLKELKKVYNRGFSTGFYFGIPDGKDFSRAEGSTATTKKEYVGRVLNYYKKSKIVYVEILTKSISKGDIIMITGKTTGVAEQKIEKIIEEKKEITKATRGMMVTFPFETLVREGDQVYVVREK